MPETTTVKFKVALNHALEQVKKKSQHTSIIIRLCCSSGRFIKLNNVWVKESRVLLSG